MDVLEREEQAFHADVAALKKWWSDSRWRYTKRPFTAEQIVSKRGNLRIEYPSNVQSKKLWKILEGRFKVCSCRICGLIVRLDADEASMDRMARLATPTDVSTRS